MNLLTAASLLALAKSIYYSYSLTSIVFFEIMWNPDEYCKLILKSVQLRRLVWKFLIAGSMFWKTQARRLIGWTVSRDQLTLSLNLGIFRTAYASSKVKSDFRLCQVTYFSTKNPLNKLVTKVNRRLLIAAEFHFCTSSGKRQLKTSQVDTKLRQPQLWK